MSSRRPIFLHKTTFFLGATALFKILTLILGTVFFLNFHAQANTNLSPVIKANLSIQGMPEGLFLPDGYTPSYGMPNRDVDTHHTLLTMLSDVRIEFLGEQSFRIHFETPAEIRVLSEGTEKQDQKISTVTYSSLDIQLEREDSNIVEVLIRLSKDHVYIHPDPNNSHGFSSLESYLDVIDQSPSLASSSNSGLFQSRPKPMVFRQLSFSGSYSDLILSNGKNPVRVRPGFQEISQISFTEQGEISIAVDGKQTTSFSIGDRDPNEFEAQHLSLQNSDSITALQKYVSIEKKWEDLLWNSGAPRVITRDNKTYLIQKKPEPNKVVSIDQAKKCNSALGGDE